MPAFKTYKLGVVPQEEKKIMEEPIYRCTRTASIWLMYAAVGVAAGCSAYQSPKLDKASSLFVEASDAIDAGETEKAIELLTASIDEDPTTWACFQRAMLRVENGEDNEAIADCELGLTVDDSHPDLNWLLKELKKKPERRFKGKNRQPPRSAK